MERGEIGRGLDGWRCGRLSGFEGPKLVPGGDCSE